MLNLYESIRSNASFSKLQMGEILVAEYTCPITEERLGVFADSDYLVHVISGKKTWHTLDGVWSAQTGETLFFKKGAAIVEQFFEDDFCLLMLFLPDHLVRDTVREIPGLLKPAQAGNPCIESAMRVETDIVLSGFFQSMLAYFSGTQKPSGALLQLKVKELIVGVLTGRSNPGLASYFLSLADRSSPSVREIMEANFRFNLSLSEFAQLCHRSLSSFKRDFKKEFDESPGKWLLWQRLDYAAALLRTSSRPVTEIAFDSGFEDVSHFARVFKGRFQLSPTSYRSASPL